MNVTKTTLAALFTAAVAAALAGCVQTSDRPAYYTQPAQPQYYSPAPPPYQPAPPNVTYTPQPAPAYQPAAPQQPVYQVYPQQPAPPPPVYTATAPVILDNQQLDQLVGPVALYPDPLLSEVFAAATYPQDIAAAAQWLQTNPTPYEQDINAQSWDPSVKALVHYPTVLVTMANQPAWTATLGAAFATQPQDVMDTVQRLRVEAQNARTLASTPQQVVVVDNGCVEILPAQPNVIYVPVYDPAVVYVATPGYDETYVTYSDGYAGGAWLDLDCDWHDRRVDQGVRWNDDWRRPDRGEDRQWQRNPSRPAPRPQFQVDTSRGAAPARGAARPDAHSKVPAFDTRLVAHTVAKPAKTSAQRPVTENANRGNSRQSATPAPQYTPRPVTPAAAAAAPTYRPLPPQEKPAPPRTSTARPVQESPRPTPTPPHEAAPHQATPPREASPPQKSEPTPPTVAHEAPAKPEPAAPHAAPAQPPHETPAPHEATPPREAPVQHEVPPQQHEAPPQQHEAPPPQAPPAREAPRETPPPPAAPPHEAPPQRPGTASHPG